MKWTVLIQYGDGSTYLWAGEATTAYKAELKAKRQCREDNHNCIEMDLDGLTALLAMPGEHNLVHHGPGGCPDEEPAPWYKDFSDLVDKFNQENGFT